MNLKTSGRNKSGQEAETGKAYAFATPWQMCTGPRRLRFFKIHRDVSALAHHDVENQSLVFFKLSEACNWTEQRRTIRCFSIQQHLHSKTCVKTMLT